MAFATAATCLAPQARIAVGRFTVPIRIWWITAFLTIGDLTAIGDDDNIGHEVHLTGAAFGLACHMAVLRKPYGWW